MYSTGRPLHEARPSPSTSLCGGRRYTAPAHRVSEDRFVHYGWVHTSLFSSNKICFYGKKKIFLKKKTLDLPHGQSGTILAVRIQIKERGTCTRMSRVTMRNDTLLLSRARTMYIVGQRLLCLFCFKNSDGKANLSQGHEIYERV